MISSDTKNIFRDGMIYEVERHKLTNPWMHPELYAQLREWVYAQPDTEALFDTQSGTTMQGCWYSNYLWLAKGSDEDMLMLKLKFTELF